MLGIDPRNEHEFDAHPTLEIFDDADAPVEPNVAAELDGMRIRPRKGKSLRDIGHEQAQSVMREEMTSLKQIEAELLNRQIPDAAKAIIDEYSLRLDRATWVIVQQMVEDGIRAGLAIRTLR